MFQNSIKWVQFSFWKPRLNVTLQMMELQYRILDKVQWMAPRWHSRRYKQTGWKHIYLHWTETSFTLKYMLVNKTSRNKAAVVWSVQKKTCFLNHQVKSDLFISLLSLWTIHWWKLFQRKKEVRVFVIFNQNVLTFSSPETTFPLMSLRLCRLLDNVNQEVKQIFRRSVNLKITLVLFC